MGNEASYPLEMCTHCKYMGFCIIIPIIVIPPMGAMHQLVKVTFYWLLPTKHF
ncbi:hypothetical protein IRJ41_012207 [Triplophysa rosa]|uniref:Uncharacterized protein n=1 Tax=Triplophysa rosa TaxID=992332 RepID=A0A9W8C9F1_TRIRA|nr:hypothetical protein IRJ41_012207 [Triplophysa rosa]